ncbi:MAG: D-mannonate oxidoreductase, partial [Adhaeribacter sp.]|nr:D-mannonate oxidoreductase [Adhaeribacter sp.]
MFDIKDKVIVITGGTGILGGAFIKAIAEARGKVIILGRNADVGREREQEVIRTGGEALFIAADVLQPEDMERACGQILETYGQIDALVNAAGG